MNRWPGIRRIFRFERGEVDRGVDDELQFHFQMKIDELRRRGLSPQAARGEATRCFGDVPATRHQLATIDRSRERGDRWRDAVGNALQDVRWALRGLRLRPMFAAAVIVTLGLGIGANVTMFGVVDRLLFRAPAYLTRPTEVNRVYFVRTVSGSERTMAALPFTRYQDLSNWTSTLARSAAMFDNHLAVGTGQLVQVLPVEEVSASFWSFFSSRPLLGRFFGPEEDRAPTGTPVVVLGYEYWHTTLGGSTAVIGSQLRIGRQSYTVIGVAPRGFIGMDPETPAAFLPITAAAVELGVGDQYTRGYGVNWLSMVIRRKTGISVEQASADLTNAYLRSDAAQRAGQPRTAPVEGARPHALAGPLLLQRGPNRGSDSRIAVWLVAVAAIVLVIACANVANLMLARALSRRRDVAVRLALGTSRARLAAQLLTESLLLATMGGLLGLGIAGWGGAFVRRFFLPGVTSVSSWTDLRVLGFTMVAALVAGAVAGVVPAVQTARGDITTALKAGVREGGFARSRVQTVLLVVQGALTLVLLIGAGLFVRSLRLAQATPLGYDASRLLWIAVGTRGSDLSDGDRIQLMSRLMAVARERPDVEDAARIVSVPFELSLGDDLFVTGIDSVARLGSFRQQYVSGDYFRTTGTPIVRGVPISETQSKDSSRVMVVSQSMARALWPHADPIGQCVRIGADSLPCTSVVGVARDIKTSSLRDDPGLTYYLPIDFAGADGGVFIRTRGDAAMRAEPIRRALQRIAPGAIFIKATPFAAILEKETRSWQLGAAMFTVFGGLALLVAAVGLYSVIAYGVTQRRHEMGVRMALGAGRASILRLVVSQALRTVGVAIGIGLVVALLAARWIAPLLFELSPRDPVTLVGCSVLMVVIAAIAAAGPAFRAARADPTGALRAE
jgi:putative ABC transport system permease protein